ncbi:GGDEF domain-containing protein [Pseudoalteromonas sp. SR44-8]|uniref:GGDEF domain-containing protein n=1 Tax=Pseudoalteromonas sp. SR44-8 TaxID=2760933 RepID=UPI002175F5FB|nr:GGDEF domain-containing protein [Pseudoalteromonas sp. SR44-8]
MKYSDNKLQQQTAKNTLQAVFSAVFVVTLFLIVTSYIYFYPELDNSIFFNGVLTDAINLLIVVAIFIIVQRANLSVFAYVNLSIGLLLWSAGLTFDLLDEVLIQPLFIGIYVEDVLRTAGMLFTCYGLKLTIGDLTSVQQQLSKELITDYLTQIANRQFFYQYMQKNQSAPYTILLIDIDFFKVINDLFGHDRGDQVLIELSSLYAKALPNNSVFARLGGEEFAIYLPGDDRPKACDLSEQLLSLAHTIELAANRTVSVSIGVSFKAPEEAFNEVVKRADQALYKAKNSGRSQYYIA